MGLLDSVLGAAVGSALGRGGFGGGMGGMGGGGLGGMLGGAMGGGMMRGGRGGGMLGSPVVKALLLALAAKAAHEYMTRNRAGAGGQAAPHGAGAQGGGGLGGVLGQVLGGGAGGAGGMGGLGGILGGLGGAGVLSDLVEQFNRRGHAGTINSWVGTGPNESIQPQALAEAIGPEHLAELEQETGMPQTQLLEELSHELPAAIDQITPQGRLPSDEELLQSGG